VGMRTEIRDDAEKFGEEIFRVARENARTTLICKLFNVTSKPWNSSGGS